jgi:hypothetical protein
MLIVVTMLICTISLKFQSPASIIIHNQCLNTELVSPVYFGNGVVCPKLSDQQIDIDVAMKIRFEIYATQDEFKGALLYKLQRNFNNQYGMDTLNTDANNSEAKYVYMLLAWEMKDSEHFAYVALVEHTNELVWNEDKLKKLYDKNHNLLKKYDETISDTWLMDDNVILKTSSKVRNSEGYFVLSISVSEEERDDYTMRPLCVDLER